MIHKHPSQPVCASSRAVVSVFSMIAGLAFLAGCTKSPTASTDFIDNGLKSGATPSLVNATWTKHLAESGGELSSIAWSGKEYVAVGTRGVILRSEDLQQWKRTAPGSDTWFTKVAWLGTKFWVGGSDGTILTSSDGISWNASHVNFQHGNASFVSTESLFVAVSGGNVLLTSPDGDNWTERAKISSGDIYGFDTFAIAWSGKQFAAVGVAQIGDRNFRVSQGAILTSPDGIRWTTTKTDGSTPFDVVWTGTQFAAVSYDSSDGFLFLSKDGSQWSRCMLPVGKTKSIAWTGSEYAIISDQVVLTSEDAVNWEQHRPGLPETFGVGATWTGTRLLVARGDSIFEAVPRSTPNRTSVSVSRN